MSGDSKTKHKANIESIQNIEFWMFLISRTTVVISQVVRWGGVVIICWLLKDCIIALAGRKTDVIVGLFVNILADFRFVICFSIAGAAAIWAFIERRLRHKATNRMEGRIKELELKFDKNRTSSNLTKEGKTNPMDRSGI